MIILHCLKESDWNKYKNGKFYGEEHLKNVGFIHCSDIETMHKVAWMFLDKLEIHVILCIETSKVKAQIKWENGGSTDYPHIYGLLNLDAAVDVVPFLKDKNNQFILNAELKKYLK